MTEKRIVLDSIRSAYNVGAIFRSAEGAGVSEIILAGYTPAPIDRFGREHIEIKKTSLGANTLVPWKLIVDPHECVELLNKYKQEGFTIVAVEQVENSISLFEYIVPDKVVYIMGNEIDGVSQEFIQIADVVIEIPMAGKKESLNVSVAAGIVMFK